MKRSAYFYEKHLQRYFDDHYWEYEEKVEWYVDPEPGIWEFKIPERRMKVMLRCDINGRVTEIKNYI